MPKDSLYKTPSVVSTNIELDVKPPRTVELSDGEVEVLRTLLDRDRTSKIVHGGLKSLLNFSDREAETLLAFLRKI